MKLSIIVPIYGVEKYLRKCVDSLLDQDLPKDEYEIILVDDGGKDACPQICDEYAEKSSLLLGRDGVGYPLVRVIHRENGGLSAARNSGIESAKGDYLMFVDSDDYLEPNVLGGLMTQVERDNLDVLRFNYQNVNEQYVIFSPNKDPKRDVDYSEVVVDGETFLNERLGPMCYAVMFVIKRDLIVKTEELRVDSGELKENQTSNIIHQTSDVNNVLFTPGIYFEDVEWTPRMLLQAKRVASTLKIVYNYMWRNGSITLPSNHQKRLKVLKDKISLINGFKEQSKLVQDSKWFTWMTGFTVMGILNMLAMMPNYERNQYFRELYALKVFPLSTKHEKMRSHKIKMQIANFSPKLYCDVMHLVFKIKDKNNA